MIAIPRFLRVQFHHLVLSTFADNNTVDIRAFLVVLLSEWLKWMSGLGSVALTTLFFYARRLTKSVRFWFWRFRVFRHSQRAYVDEGVMPDCRLRTGTSRAWSSKSKK